MYSLILVVALTFPALSYGQDLCSRLILRQPPPAAYVKIYENSHYKVVRAQKGKHGGMRITVERKTPQEDSINDWIVPHLTKKTDNAPPGNVLRFIEGTPSAVSYSAGFKAMDKNFRPVPILTETKYVEFPDRAETNGFLKLLDEKLTAKDYFGMPFQFYLDKTIASDFEFVSHSVRYLIPMAEHRIIFYHDLNYHLLPLLVLSKPMVLHSTQLSNAFIAFAKWVKENHPSLFTTQFLEDLFETRAHQIDLLGNVSVYLKNPLNDKNREKAMTALKAFTGSGMSAADFLAASVLLKKRTVDAFFEIPIAVIDQFVAQAPTDLKQKDEYLLNLFKDEAEVLKALSARMKEVEHALVD